MTSQLLLIFNGLTYGGLLFVIASGFTLIFGLMRIVNLSHGIFYLLGAYISYSVQQQSQSWFFGIFVGTIAVGITALLVYLLVQRINDALPQTLLTLGIAIMMGDLCLWIWGGLPMTLRAPAALRVPVTIGGFMYPGFRLFVLGVAIVIGVGLWTLLYRTRLGGVIRAGVDNRAIVSTLGINIDRVFAMVFIFGGLLTGFSGAMGGSYLAFGPGKDFEILTYALVVVIIGGMGSIYGSAIGALIVGIVDSFGRTYFSELSPFLLSGTLIVILAFRPQGLFGRAR